MLGSDAPADAVAEGGRHPATSTSTNTRLALRQFAALLRKNFTLTVRSRRTPLGLGGWGGLLLQVLLPALFFGLMWIPKHYIKPIEHPVFLQRQSYDIDSKFWAGPSPYEGVARRVVAAVAHAPLSASPVVAMNAVNPPHSHRTRPRPAPRPTSPAETTHRPCLPQPQQRESAARPRHPRGAPHRRADGGGRVLSRPAVQAHLQPRHHQHVRVPLRGLTGAAAVRGERRVWGLGAACGCAGGWGGERPVGATLRRWVWQSPKQTC